MDYSLIFVLVVGIVCAVICRAIAKGNRRNPDTALLYGMLFGLFAVVGYLIAGKPKIQCRHCGAAMNYGFETCHKCGGQTVFRERPTVQVDLSTRMAVRVFLILMLVAVGVIAFLSSKL